MKVCLTKHDEMSSFFLNFLYAHCLEILHVQLKITHFITIYNSNVKRIFFKKTSSNIWLWFKKWSWYYTQHIVGIVVPQLCSFYNSWVHVGVIANKCDWLMECGENVSLTLSVLFTLTGNRLVQAPRKAIILRVIWGQRSVHTSSVSRTHTYTLSLHRVKS